MRFLLTTCCVVFFAVASWAQSRQLTGQIIGEDKEPMIGVPVLLKGTSVGASTDIDGNFTLSVPDSVSAPVLVISYVGYKTQEIPASSASNFNVTLVEDSKVLDEVIVVGYGTIKKSDLTGSISSLKPDDVKQVPSGSVLESVQGKAAGVDITRSTGSASEQPKITVRGNRSIMAGNEPLYIVDGVQYSSIQDINPNDILSMEVLKDASSTAIYGSRGSNGVIIITTKKGAAGDIKVSINSYVGQSSAFAFPSSMNGNDYATLKREANRTRGVTDDAAIFGTQELENLRNGVSTDYTRELIKKGSQKDIQIGISGGTEKLKTYFSLDYYNEQGIVRNDQLKRYTGRLNLDYQVKKYLKVGTQTQITSYDQNIRTNPLGLAAKINPLSKPFNDDGTIAQYPLSGKDINPLIDEQPNAAIDRKKVLRIFPTIYAEFNILKGLTARTNFSVNWDNTNEGIYMDRYSVDRNGAASKASHDGTYKTNINWQGILNYNLTLKEKHSFNFLALSEIVDNKTEAYFASGQNQLLATQSYYNLNGAPDAISVNSYYRGNRIISFAGRVNYAFKGKYLFGVTAREDGASVLAEEKKWYFFPSVSGGWRISDEEFLKNQKLFSTIKLRASYGVAGNSQIDPYSSQSTLVRISNSFGDASATGYALNPKIGNSNVTWEKSKTVNIGLDLGILKERITATFDWYRTNTDDLLLSRSLPASSGVNSTTQNIGKTRNQGVELAISSVNIEMKKFRWSSTFTFTRNREKVLELVDGLQYLNIGTSSTVNGLTVYDPNKPRYVVVGSPAGNSSSPAFYDFEKVGIWQADQADEAAKYGQKPGDIHVKDQNGDGKIDLNDRIVIGSPVPKWSGSFNSNMTAYGFDLNIYLFARIGSTIDMNSTRNVYDPTGTENSLAGSNYWTPENPSNDLPRPNSNVSAANTLYYSTTGYKDGSFIKVRNVTLGYTLPSAFTDKWKISKLRFYVTAKNLGILYSKIKGYDPEMNGSLTFPTTRLYLMGVNLEF